MHKNIKKLKCEKKTRVFNEDAFNFFKNEELKNEKLDLIFLDPPYKEENIKIILENIANLKTDNKAKFDKTTILNCSKINIPYQIPFKILLRITVMLIRNIGLHLYLIL